MRDHWTSAENQSLEQIENDLVKILRETTSAEAVHAYLVDCVSKASTPRVVIYAAMIYGAVREWMLTMREPGKKDAQLDEKISKLFKELAPH